MFSLYRTFVRFATKKSSGNTKSKRSPAGKRLGLKKSHLQSVIPGNIILRQRGVKWKPGQNVGMGRDHTIFSFIDGRVMFVKEWIKQRGAQVKKTFVHVVREGDDVTLYSPKRSGCKTWKKPCPLNLKWEQLQSKESAARALEMMLRDREDRQEFGVKRLHLWAEQKIEEIRSLLKNNKFS